MLILNDMQKEKPTRTKLRYIFLAVMFALFINMGGALTEAAEITTDSAEGIVKISGTVSSGEADQTLSIYVEKQSDAILEPAYVNQIKSDADGSYHISFYLASPGRYTLYLTEAGKTLPTVTDFHFAKESDKETALAMINGASEASIRTVMEQYADALDVGGLYYELKETEGGQLSQLYKMISDHGDFGTVNDFEQWFKETVLVYWLNHNTSSGGAEACRILETYGEEIGITQWSSYAYYQDFDKVQRESVGSKLSAQNLVSFEQLEKRFDEVIFLQFIDDCASYGAVRKLFQSSGAKVGLNLTEYFNLHNSADVDKGIYGESFPDIASLQRKLDSLVEQRAKIESASAGGHSGGGGGSGGSSGRNSAAVLDNVISVDHSGGDTSYVPFDDLNQAEWAKESILFLYDRDIISDDAERKFRPNDQITREEFLKMLVAAFKLPLEHSNVNFTDVKDTDWFYPYVGAAYQAGLIRGIGDGMFGSGRNITRMEAATMVYRFACYSGMEFSTDGEPFADSASFADYAAEPIQALKNKNVINGYDGNIFAGEARLTRAETAKIIHRLLEVQYEN